MDKYPTMKLIAVIIKMIIGFNIPNTEPSPKIISKRMAPKVTGMDIKKLNLKAVSF